MVDIHSHILWALDDGAGTIAESVAMLQLAAESGTTDIVASPHANYRYHYDPVIVAQRIAELTATAAGKPRIHRGCDLHLSFDNVQAVLADPLPYTIDGGSYLLVEFPDASVAGMDKILAMLLDRGLIPIMTHPERNFQLFTIPKYFVEWIQRGCLVQVTAQSLLGRFGKQAEASAWEMVDRGLVHFVASDAHDPDDRMPRLDLAFDAVARRAGASVARQLFVVNPGAVLTGDQVDNPPPKRRSWLRRWK